MQIDLNLKLEDIFLYTGEYELKANPFSAKGLLEQYLSANQLEPTASIARVLAAPDQLVGVMVLWERLPFLNIQPTYTQGPTPDYAGNNVPQHLRILTEVIGQDPEIPEELRQRTHQFLTLKCPSDLELGLTVKLNTSHPNIRGRQRTVENGQQGLSFSIEIILYVPAEPDAVARVKVPCRIEPAEQPPIYDGIVSIDLGNTRSFMVCMNRGTAFLQNLGPEEPFECLYLDPEDRFEDPTVLSGLGIKKLEPNDDETSRYFQGHFEIGRRAKNSSDGLVLAPKRMVVDPHQGERYGITIGGEDVEIPKKVPAELFLSRLIQTFVREKKAMPMELHITYPTTFSLREIGELRLSYYDALRMAAGFPTRRSAQTIPERRALNKRVSKTVPVPLDEASAAASYLLFRDYVLGPGGIRSFMDIFPQGLNVLVYDCGGGTTDIALVRAQGGRTFDEATQTDKFSFEVRNIGRTGHRRFGGDEMTRVVYRLLKIKIAHAVVGAARELGLTLPQGPLDRETVQNVTDISADLLQWASRIISTEWMHSGPAPGSRVPLPVDNMHDQQQLVLELWETAEALKRELAKPAAESIQLSKVAAWQGTQPTFFDFISQLHPGLNQIERAAIYEQWESITISRAEVDAALEPTVRETVEKMNYLIHHKLEPPEQVGQIYIVGNGSRYPLIRECITKYLKVQFAKDKTKQEDIQTKLAVAKGACINGWLAQDRTLIEWRADHELMHKLPYDVVLGGLGGGTPEIIYQEGDDCLKLVTKKIAVHDATMGNEVANNITLYRRWPGDERISKFMEFQFPRALVGPAVAVWFEPEEQMFYMRDEGAAMGGRVSGREVIEADYVPHVQSGLI